MPTTWDDAAELWLARLANQGRAASTLVAYAHDLAGLGQDIAEVLGHDPFSLHEIDSDVLDLALARFRTRPDRRYSRRRDAGTGRSSASMARRMAAARGLLTWAYDTGRIDADLSRSLRTPKASRRLPRLLDRDTAAVIVDAAGERSRWPERDRLIVALGLCCGMRRSEIVTLGLVDITGDPPVRLRVLGKGGKERVLGVPPLVADLLAGYLPTRAARLAVMGAESPRVILSSRARIVDGEPVVDATADTVVYVVDATMRALGVRDRGKLAHALRHTFAASALDEGVMNLRELQESLGHASLATTQIYTHVVADEVVAAMAAHPLGRRSR